MKSVKGMFSRGDTDRFSPLLGNLYHHDYFMLAADFGSYMECQRAVGAAYRDYPPLVPLSHFEHRERRLVFFGQNHTGI